MNLGAADKLHETATATEPVKDDYDSLTGLLTFDAFRPKAQVVLDRPASGGQAPHVVY